MGDFPLNIDPKPINGGVLVRMIGGSNKTSGGIILPPTAQARPTQGRVEEISRGYYDTGVFREHEVKVGDIVVFSSNSGFDLILDDIEFRIIHEKEIIAILRGVNYGEETI